MQTLNWQKLWDDLYNVALNDKTSWGRNELRERMDYMEKIAVRELEKENGGIPKTN